MTTAGLLFVVATPIGNLDDISLRARTVLAQVDVIAAEDTRRTRGLLSHLGIRARLLSLHEHNEAQRVPALLDRIAAGERVALVSDSGTPLISDPGYRLVAGARARGLQVTPVPGCCAAIAALSVAGLPSDRFHFEGFLPARGRARLARLDELARLECTLILYESVHRIGETLADLALACGPARQAFLARELTKLHESVYYGTLAEVRAALSADPATGKGEMTLVVAGCEATAPSGTHLENVVKALRAELPAPQAARLAARITGVSRNQAYRLAIRVGPDPISTDS